MYIGLRPMNFNVEIYLIAEYLFFVGVVIHNMFAKQM